MTENSNKIRILAVSSGGGHWVQLLRLMAAFTDYDIAYVTVNDAYRTQVSGHRFYALNDATRWNKIGLITMAARLTAIVARERPHVVISTGAAPGYVALRLGHLIGARTIWLDSMANVERLSLSGEKIKGHADLWLTQWDHLATPGGPRYAGSVL